MTSNVRSGSGLSSSAAVEVLFCAILDELYNGGKLTAKRRAQISQYAENVYFGKPSGLMDQMASSVGGLSYIDFKEDDPVVQALSYDFAAKGYALVVVNSGGSHDDLTPEYSAIPAEMHAVAHFFG
jgi:galactokinase